MTMGRSPAPAPADFAHYAVTESWNQLRKRYRQCTPTLQRWVNDLGIVRPVMYGGRPQRPLPEDFAVLCQTMTNVQLQAHYGIGGETITRFLRECGGRQKSAAEIPEDFAAQWAAKSEKELQGHYGRGQATISGWVKALGLTRQQGKRINQPKAEPKPKKPKLKIVKQRGFALMPVDRAHKDISRAGLAADFLRRFGPVARCNADGRYNPNGTHWRRSSSVLTAAEVMERAERLGWQPDAWKEVRAA